MDKLLKIINSILEKKEIEILPAIEGSLSLRNDLDFTSLDLAELTVKVEDEFDIDIFEDGVVDKISEIIELIKV